LGNEVPWPEGPGARIFLYVKRFLPQLDALIDHLAASPHSVIAFVPDLDEARRARLASRRRIVSRRPVLLKALMRRCDLLISHGGEIATGALMHGVPALLFPSHYEQYLTALRLEALGAARWLPHSTQAADAGRAIDSMLRERAHAASARAFANRYAAFSPAEQRRRIVLRIEELLSRGSAGLPPRGAPPILSPSPPTQESAR